MRLSSIGRACVACSLLFLAACNEPAQAPKSTTPKVEVPKPAPKKDDDPAFTKLVADMTTVGSHIGILAYCNVNGLYSSPIMLDSYERTRAIVVPLRDSGVEKMAAVASISYAAFNQAGSTGTLSVVTPATEGDGKFSVKNTEITDEAGCKAVETTVKSYREKGGILDVKPYTAGNPT